MDHLVYAQVYMSDLTRIDDMNAMWAQYFPLNAPARSVVGVAHMPLDTRVEISAVAVRDLTKKQVVKVRGVSSRTTVSPAVYAAGRVYLSGVLGRDAGTARLPDSLEEQVKLAAEHSAVILAGAGRKPSDLLTTVYITARMPVEIAERGLRKAGYKDFVLVPVTDIPLRSNIEITGIAARDLRMQSGRGDTKAVLAGFADLRDAVVSNVYIDSIVNFQSMNEAYKPFFPTMPPARTTVQPFTEADHGEHAGAGERPRVQPLHKGLHGNLITILSLK
jgi:enamine deaminase RidA (YjgF/YER057c/UK114 family)